MKIIFRSQGVIITEIKCRKELKFNVKLIHFNPTLNNNNNNRKKK